MDRLILDKVDFRAKEITKYREVHYIMTKVSIHQEVIVILNRCINQTTELQNMWSKSDKTKGRNRQIHNYS